MAKVFKKIKSVMKDKKKRTIILAQHGFYKNMSDEDFLRMQFKNVFGYELNLDNPQTFSEKLQWLKLYDRNPKYTMMVDKYAVKSYVASLIGEEHIIKTLGVWDSFDEIDFDSLPDQFVLKCTHDSGGLVICTDKSKLDLNKARKKINKSLANNYYLQNREWPYKDVKPRIIAEHYMKDISATSMIDYKFYCFNGEPKFLYVSQGLENHSTAKISYVTLDWEKAPYKRTDYSSFDSLPPKPKTFDEMVELAKTLSRSIPFSRIDFYEINSNLYFGEITFFPGSGLSLFDPDEWDAKIGSWITLPLQN